MVRIHLLSQNTSWTTYLELADIFLYPEFKAVAVVAGPLSLQGEGVLLRKEGSTGGWRKRRKGKGKFKGVSGTI